MSVLAEIVARRRSRMEREGSALGCRLPERRQVPLVPFGRAPFIICEIKRRSPSRGALSEGLDAPAQAARYAAGGAPTVSVLTEEDYFHGSLTDLIAVKERNPRLSVLRKDFLLNTDDIEISYRAGADAVLLIPAILDPVTLREMYDRAADLGLACLVEVHTEEEIERVTPLRPRFTGINARDLRSFQVDLGLPLKLQSRIGWETKLVFESGIHSREQAAFASASGFDGVLVGESVVREPRLVGELVAGLAEGRGTFQGVDPSGTGTAQVAGPGRRDFWRRLFGAGRDCPGKPLVKICGLTNREDALLADSLGADLLGFVFAPSKRRADSRAVRGIGETRAPKVGVVVLEGGGARLEGEVRELLECGALDAVQFHGDEAPESCYHLAFPYYKALQLKSTDECGRIARYRCPRVLVDAHAEGLRGGTGASLEAAIVREAQKSGPLWLAGGIGPHNIYETVQRYGPELVDASSALETEPGRKDPQKLRAFFAEIARAAEQPRDVRPQGATAGS